MFFSGSKPTGGQTGELLLLIKAEREPCMIKLHLFSPASVPYFFCFSKIDQKRLKGNKCNITKYRRFQAVGYYIFCILSLG